MKYTFFFLAVLLLMTSSKCEEAKGQDTIMRISHGSSFGMCMGYCFNELTYTKSDKIKYSKAYGRTPVADYPDKFDSLTMDPAIWKDLISKIDTAVFYKLPERIGCPDCADGGAEWIEIQTVDKTYRVTFEYGKNVSEIDLLLQALRKEKEAMKSEE